MSSVTARSDKTERGQRCKRLVLEVSVATYMLCHKHFAGNSRALTKTVMNALRKPTCFSTDCDCRFPGAEFVVCRGRMRCRQLWKGGRGFAPCMRLAVLCSLVPGTLEHKTAS